MATLSSVITSEPDKPVWGGFRVAYLDMRAGDALGAGTSIHLEITAETAREPDIGLSIARDDGFILATDPSSSRYGDLDCDNKVGPPDVLVALRGNPFPCNPIADANCTGSIDAHDAIDIIAFLGNVARPQSSDCPPIGFSPDDPTPTPTPEPTPEPTPTEEATPTPTATPEP